MIEGCAHPSCWLEHSDAAAGERIRRVPPKLMAHAREAARVDPSPLRSLRSLSRVTGTLPRSSNRCPGSGWGALPGISLVRVILLSTRLSWCWDVCALVALDVHGARPEHLDPSS